MPGTPHPTSPAETPVRQVRRLYEELLTAWNHRDAPGMAALFAPDATMIGFDGSQVPGAEVADHLTPIFRDHPTAPYVWKIQDARPLTDDVVLLHSLVGMIPPGRTDLDPAVNAVQCLVAQHLSGTWRVALFQNTPAQYHGRPEAAEAHTRELREVLGERPDFGR